MSARRALGTVLVLGAALLACSGPLADGVTATSGAPTMPSGTVERIKDGDTLLLTDGRTVRLLGIDTPEKGRCWAQEATNALATMVPPGSPITLTQDPTQDQLDKYGRTLAYVDSPTTGDAGENLLRQGAAKAYVYRGRPVMRAPTYAQAEQQARQNALGIWVPTCDAYPPGS